MTSKGTIVMGVLFGNLVVIVVCVVVGLNVVGVSC